MIFDEFIYFVHCIYICLKWIICNNCNIIFFFYGREQREFSPASSLDHFTLSSHLTSPRCRSSLVYHPPRHIYYWTPPLHTQRIYLPLSFPSLLLQLVLSCRFVYVFIPLLICRRSDAHATVVYCIINVDSRLRLSVFLFPYTNLFLSLFFFYNDGGVCICI